MADAGLCLKEWPALAKGGSWGTKRWEGEGGGGNEKPKKAGARSRRAVARNNKREGGGWGHGVKIVGFRSKKRREPGVKKARGPEFFNDIKCPDRPSPICIYILMDFDN